MMVEAMILIAESAYKELLHCQKQYLELTQKKSKNSNDAIESLPKTLDKKSECLCNGQSGEKKSECLCKDQFGEGFPEFGSNCNCTKKTSESKSEKSTSEKLLPISTFKTSSEFFSELANQTGFKRSPQKYRAVAEIIFFAPGIMIGTDNVIHFQGAKIDGSNIYDVIRNEVNGGKRYIPGKVVIDRILEKSNIFFTKQRRKRGKIENEEDCDEWYRLL